MATPCGQASGPRSSGERERETEPSPSRSSRPQFNSHSSSPIDSALSVPPFSERSNTCKSQSTPPLTSPKELTANHPLPTEEQSGSIHRKASVPTRRWTFFSWLFGFFLQYLTPLFNVSIRGNRRQQDSPTEQESFQRTIKLALWVDGEEKVRVAQALFDTGNPKNFISRDLAEQQFGFVFANPEPIKVLDLPGQSEAYSIRQLKGRWIFKHHGVDPKFMTDVFEVSSNLDERYDVIIGQESLNKAGVLLVREDVGFTGFRTQMPQVDGRYI